MNDGLIDNPIRIGWKAKVQVDSLCWSFLNSLRWANLSKFPSFRLFPFFQRFCSSPADAPSTRPNYSTRKPISPESSLMNPPPSRLPKPALWSWSQKSFWTEETSVAVKPPFSGVCLRSPTTESGSLRRARMIRRPSFDYLEWFHLILEIPGLIRIMFLSCRFPSNIAPETCSPRPSRKKV